MKESFGADVATLWYSALWSLKPLTPFDLKRGWKPNRKWVVPINIYFHLFSKCLRSFFCLHRFKGGNDADHVNGFVERRAKENIPKAQYLFLSCVTLYELLLKCLIKIQDFNFKKLKVWS